jgi:hypothetical protein
VSEFFALSVGEREFLVNIIISSRMDEYILHNSYNACLN